MKTLHKKLKAKLRKAKYFKDKNIVKNNLSQKTFKDIRLTKIPLKK